MYAAGIVYGFFYFYPNTYVNTIDVGMTKPEDAEEVILPTETTLSVKRIDGSTESIDLVKADYDVKTESPVAHLLRSQKQMAWPVTLFNDTEFEDKLVYSFDKDKLKKEISGLEAFDEAYVKAPKDACIEVDSEGHYEIIPEDDGNTLIPEKVYDIAGNAVSEGLYEIDLEENGCYEKAEIRRDNEELVNKMNLIRALGEEVITVNLTDAEEVLDTMTLTEMAYFDSEWNLAVDWDKLDAYVDELAEKYETYMQKRKFVTHDGATIETGGSQSNGIAIDTYGFLMDRVETFNAIYHAILSAESQTVDAVWTVPALTRGQDNLDIGNTYLEVSIEKQHLWYYQDGKVVLETDVVTGMPTPSRATPTGLFRIFGKLEDTNLIGEMDGESWNSHVDFWMSVTWDAVGMHDAPWRNAFGGQIYKTNGSHGCINLPLDKERWLYYNVEMDTPVIIY